MSTKMKSYLLGATFLLTVEAAVGTQCGGPLTNNSGTITSPSYPHPYGVDLNCTWTIKKTVYISIKELVLDAGDQLLVYDGATDGVLIHNITETKGFGVVYSSANLTTIVFLSVNTTSPQADRRFVLLYNTAECVIPVAPSTSLLPSPYFVQSAGTINCTYVLNINSSQHVIDLTFVQFRLKKGQVSVKEGNKTLATFTNDDQNPSDVLVPSGSVIINMILSASLKQNFTLAYSKWDKDCSGMKTVETKTVVSSPNHHGNYDNNLHCLITLSSPINSTLRLEFSEFILADANDLVIIRDGGSVLSDNIAVLSVGSQLVGVYYLTSSNVTQIQFITDQLLTARGFQLVVTPEAYGRRFVDSGNFAVGIQAQVTDVSEPGSVLPSSDVISYQFQAEEDSQVYVVFRPDAVIMPNTTIECYDGFSPDDGMVGYLTSVSAFHPVFSSGNRLLVIIKGFLHNGTMTRQYLSGSFKTVNNDGTLLNSLKETGSLALTLMEDEYPWNATWLIHNYEAIEVISLKLHSVTLGQNSSVSIYEGLSDQSWLMTKINVSTADLPEIYIPKDSDGCRLVYETNHKQGDASLDRLDVGMQAVDMQLVRMHTAEMPDRSVDRMPRPVLKATYSRLPDCKANMTDHSGTILTPGYPGLYPFNADCFWNISIPKHKLIHLSFNTFDLAPFHQVQVSGISYYDYNKTVGIETERYRNVSMTDLGIFGGQSKPNDIVWNGNNSHIEVRFSSGFEKNPTGGVYVAQGVNISYEVIDCGGNFTGSNATLNIPHGIIAGSNVTLTCVWIISLPNISRTNGSVNIVSFTYHFTRTNKSLLVIRDGPSSASESIPLNATATGNPLLSRTDKLWIKYTFQMSQNDNQYFQLNYTTHVCPKSQQCNNSICMHDDWRCNGRDDCGDGSDEDGCTYGKPGQEGYAGWVLGIVIVATFILTIVLTIIVLMIYRRYRYSNYSELRDLMAPVPT